MGLRDAIKQIVKQELTEQMVIGTVKSVDETKHTCVVEPVNGDVDYYAVRLSANKQGMIIIPKIGSYVLIGKLANQSNNYMIIGYTEFKKLVITSDSNGKIEMTDNGEVFVNGQNFGGLIKIQELITQLTKATTFLDVFQTALSTPVNEPGNGAPSALQAALNLALATLQLPDYSNIENDTVKHGG